MEKYNNNNEISFLNLDNTFNEKENIILPKIKKKFNSYENKMKVNKICQCEKNYNSYNKVNYPAFLTSTKSETEKINCYNSNKYNIRNDINNEDKIFKLLKEKIEIKPINPNIFHYNKTKNNLRSNNILITYLNDASLLKNSYFGIREKRKLKEVKVGRILTLSNTYKQIDNPNNVLNNNNILDLRIYRNKYAKNNKTKRFKTLDKKNIKNDISDYINSNWRKNFNCSLKYKYNKNKKSIDEVTLKIEKIDQQVKKTFDIFKNETDEIFDKAMDIKNDKKKKKFQKIF